MKSINYSLRAAMLVFVLGSFTSVVTQTASASSVIVGNCNPGGVHFQTIQAAINAVGPGFIIKICPGTYPEQLSINQQVTLQGIASGNQDGVVITSPSSGLVQNTISLATGNAIAAHVWIDGASGVNMTNLIVDSSGNNINSCAPDLIGILYQNSSGTLNHVVTRNQWVGASESDTNFNGCQTGLGIFVQSGTGGTSVLTVTNSSVHDYQKNGITGNETGTTLNVNSSQVVGQGPTNGAAENGIQIGFGARGIVSGNSVIDDIWAPDTSSDPGDAAAGILLFDAASGAVTVKSNNVGNTQFGIALVTDKTGLDDGETVASNKVFATRIFDAIDVCSNNNTIQTNAVSNSSESAIHLDASCGTTGNGNSVTGNTITDANVGLLKDTGVSGNTVTPNTYFTSIKTDPPGNVRTRLPYKPARP
jgi:Periplasmic copper-binding protein (NosD)